MSSDLASAEKARSRRVAAALALFLGGIGIHKFYLGLKGQGWLSILFCWTFIPLLISFVETILILMISDKEFQTKYG